MFVFWWAVLNSSSIFFPPLYFFFPRLALHLFIEFVNYLIKKSQEKKTTGRHCPHFLPSLNISVWKFMFWWRLKWTLSLSYILSDWYKCARWLPFDSWCNDRAASSIYIFYLANWSRPPPSPPHTDTHVVFFNLSPGELNIRVALLKAVIKSRQWSLKTCCPTAPHVMSAFRGLIQATTSHKRVNSCSQRALSKHTWLAVKQKPGCL